MATDYGVLLSLDPRVLCVLPGKADALRALKRELLADPDAQALDTLQFLADLERRDGVLVDDVCTAPATPRDCSPGGISRAARASR
jgi:hypothetical protein